MPSTRQSGEQLAAPMDFSDDDFDPDYRESSEEEEELPKSMHRDRAHWIETNVEDIEWLYRKLLEDGRSIMGNSFMQSATINSFAYYLYAHTTPFSKD